MTDTRHRSADERRADIQASAAALGITEAYISTLVETFYARVRVDPELGPIFNNAIGHEWDVHLEKIKAFWSSVALNTGRYDGRPVPAHKKHPEIQEQHFGIWLGLFEQTLRDTAPTEGAAAYFLERAQRIAQSLRMALFGIDLFEGPRPTP